MAEILAGVPITNELALIAERIRSNVRHTTESIIAIGNDLIAARAMLARGEFLPWIDNEFSWSRATAYNFIAAAELANKFPTVRKLQAKTVYLLAAKSTPAPIVAEAISTLDSGNPINHTDVALKVRAERWKQQRERAIANKSKRAIRAAASEAKAEKEFAAWKAKKDFALAEIIALLSGKGIDAGAILAIEDRAHAHGLTREALEKMAAEA
jgi:hypothetical protein